MQESIDNESRLMVIRALNSLTTFKEKSGPEVVSYLLGYEDAVCSHKFVPLPIRAFIGFLSAHGLQLPFRGGGDDKDVRMISQTRTGLMVRATMMVDYVYRAESLSELCVYEFCSNWYRVLIGNRQHPVQFLPGHPEVEEACLVRSQFPRVPVLAGIAVPKASEKDIFGALLLVLFKPFRLETIQDLNPLENWDESFSEWEKVCSPEIKVYVEQFRQLGEGKDLLELERDEHLAELRGEQAIPDEMTAKIVDDDDEKLADPAEQAEGQGEGGGGDELEELEDYGGIELKEDPFALEFELELVTNRGFMETRFDVASGSDRDFC